MTLICCTFKIQNAEASGITTVLTSRSTYDLNNDGKKDAITVVQPSSQNNFSGKLYINGKKLYEFPKKKFNLGCRYRIITLKNGRRFILLTAEGPNPGISDDILLQYTSKAKIKKIFSFQSALKIFGGSGLITQNPQKTSIKVSGNTVAIAYQKMLWTTGGIDLDFKFSYKNGTLKRTSYYGNVNGTYRRITSKNIQTYKTINKNNKAIVFKKNTTVYVKKYYLKGTKMWLQLRDSKGRVGWISCLTKNPGGAKSPIFSNGFYAG